MLGSPMNVLMQKHFRDMLLTIIWKYYDCEIWAQIIERINYYLRWKAEELKLAGSLRQLYSACSMTFEQLWLPVEISIHLYRCVITISRQCVSWVLTFFLNTWRFTIKLSAAVSVGKFCICTAQWNISHRNLPTVGIYTIHLSCLFPKKFSSH